MNKIKYLIFTILCFGIFNLSIYAASISASVTSTSVTVGNTITLKLTGNDLAGKFSITSSDSSILTVGTSSVWLDNSGTSIKLTAKKAGTVKVTVAAVDATTYAGKSFTDGKTFTITVKNPVVVTPKVKSSNNNLSSITVEGAKLDKTFSKETLEYNVELDAGTETVKINAQLADSSAKVTGTGKHEVSVGNNKIELKVTAENGSVKTYIINVTVKDYDPIKINIDGEEYTVIRKEKDLPKVSEYNTVKKIEFQDNQIDSYYNETLEYTIIGVINTDGDKELYLYKDNTYTKYDEYTFNGITLRVLSKNVEGEVKKSTFKYADSIVNAYQNIKLDILKNTYALDNNDIEGNNFYLFYAINLSTGKEDLYQYDSVENTVQRFNIELLDMYKDRSDLYYIVILGCILGIGLLIILFSIILINNSKNKKKKIVKEEFVLEKEEIDDIEEPIINKKKKKNRD